MQTWQASEYMYAFPASVQGRIFLFPLGSAHSHCGYFCPCSLLSTHHGNLNSGLIIRSPFVDQLPVSVFSRVFLLSCGSHSLNTCSLGVNLRTACQRAAASNNWSSNNVLTLMGVLGTVGLFQVPQAFLQGCWNLSGWAEKWWCEPFCRQNTWNLQGKVAAWVPGPYRFRAAEATTLLKIMLLGREGYVDIFKTLIHRYCSLRCGHTAGQARSPNLFWFPLCQNAYIFKQSLTV